MKIAVIGSGIGGLAIAARLSKKGHNVTVYEKNSVAGGKISQIKERGYRFDTGPSLFTLPYLTEEIAEINYFKLENSCRYFYEDGTVLNFYQNPDRLKKELEEKSISDYDNICKRLKDSEEIYNLTSNLFIFNSFHKIKNFLKPENRKIPLRLNKIGFHRSMHSANRALFKDKRVIQIFDRYATYNGSSPYRAPATLNMISHLEHNIGAFFPEKGIFSIIESIYNQCLSTGVKFEFNTLVKEIVSDKIRGAYAIKANNEKVAFDIIVSDSDVNYLSQNMFGKEKRYPLAGRLKRAEPSSSALIFYWGVKAEFKLFDIHNILFSSQYKREFSALFETKELYHDPTIYIFISKRAVESDAPEGCENWFVMVNAPTNSGQNWPLAVKQAKRDIIQKINKIINAQQSLHNRSSENIDIEKLIEIEHIASPVTIEKNTLSSHGALYGSSSNSLLSAFLRHPNSLKSIPNLFFVGGSVHPGGGIPLCLASAKIVEKEIDEIYSY
jgi:diapolycopene oxygenase